MLHANEELGPPARSALPNDLSMQARHACRLACLCTDCAGLHFNLHQDIGTVWGRRWCDLTPGAEACEPRGRICECKGGRRANSARVARCGNGLNQWNSFSHPKSIVLRAVGEFNANTNYTCRPTLLLHGCPAQRHPPPGRRTPVQRSSARG